MTQRTQFGKHLIIDFVGARYTTNTERIEYALTQAPAAANAVVLDTTVHGFVDSDGVTGIAILAESHISIHTWPEHDYMALDIFMCGASDPYLALEWLTGFFQPTTVETRLLERGIDSKT